jgi:broad specificity phosphatase PhoE
MRMRFETLAATVLLAASWMSPAGASAQEVIFLIRHAEQTGPRHHSLDADPTLAEAGHRRAAALAKQLKDAGITAIYTSDAVRTQQTAEPTAKALGIQPKVVARQDVEGLVKRLRTEHPHDRVLVVNHALNIPAILKAFGHPGGITVAVDDYEPLLVIVPLPDGPPVVVMLRL